MIFLGVILASAGYFAHLPIMWVSGGVITALAVLHSMGAFKTRGSETDRSQSRYHHVLEDDPNSAVEDRDT
jgi:hypothetical protein